MADLPRLRVLITDERSDVLEALAGLVRGAGHEPVACEAGVSDAAAAVERERPDVAIVGVHEDVGHAIDLLDALASAGEVPVVVTLDDADEQFIAEAAERGVFASAAPSDRDSLVTALRLAHARAREHRGTLVERVRELEDRMQRRAVVERAKGVLMDTQGLKEADAFRRIQRLSMNSRKSMREVAEAILLAHEAGHSL